MQTAIQTITPYLARCYLDKSDGNRTLKAAKVDSYARDMKAGYWLLNGEAIIFDEDGRLVDGHHRLKACIKSGRPFESLIVQGVAKSARTTIDMGASRTVVDVLSFDGEKNASALVGAINAAVSIGNNRPRSANLSSSEVLEFIRDYPMAREYARATTRNTLPRVGSVLCGIGIATHYTGQSEAFCDFLHVLRSGVPSQPGCAAHALRDRIMRDAGHRRKMPLQEAQRLAVSAWNKFVDRQPVSQLRVGKEYEVKGWCPEICNRITAS